MNSGPKKQYGLSKGRYAHRIILRFQCSFPRNALRASPIFQSRLSLKLYFSASSLSDRAVSIISLARASISEC